VSGDSTPYLALITSEHAAAPKFRAAVAILAQWGADRVALINSLPAAFDLDLAIGAQLDRLGERIGITRYVQVPLVGVYFAWGTAGVGWGQGTWLGPFDPTTGQVALADDAYRQLLRFKVAANQWDGTIPGAYAAFGQLLAGTGAEALIQDYGDMTMAFALLGPIPSAVLQALFQEGALILRPAGVRATIFTPSVPATPYFGWGIENSSISGWGVGAWGIVDATA
jgi:hypothetical protein